MKPGVDAVAGDERMERLRLGIRGVVQGVGFRPFVYRLAVELGVGGWVCNGRQGVTLEVEGLRGALDRFRERVVAEAPPHSRIEAVEPVWLAPCGTVGFGIRESALEEGGDGLVFVVPDIATCAACRDEIFDPRNRRYRYPFTNCTHCGPRYTILEAVPYDRARTSMRGFRMCARCQAEYDDPCDRRFHAQPNACPDCGPQLAYWGPLGEVLATRDQAVAAAVSALRSGQVVAVKGIGGFHLWAAAHDDAAVAVLRVRKHRETKPLALMAPTLDWVRYVCEVSVLEERLLTSAEAPIVLLRRRGGGVAPAGGWPSSAVAPGNPHLGIMLPYSPLHHLLLAELGCAVVATSGNRGDEPICTDDLEARERLRGMADGFLVHDRPIVRPVDDSIVREMCDRPLVLRRARGYAPSVIRLGGVLGGEGGAEKVGRVVLGVGGQMKSAVALSDGRQAFVGQHLGDLETPLACAAFRRCIADLEGLFEIRPSGVATDGHPDYVSTRCALELGLPRVRVQHHYAHVLACLAENETAPPALGVVWDGTGDGMDGTVWGGEFLRVRRSGWERVARMRPFRLPGGEAGVREPRRSALGVFFEMDGAGAMEARGCPAWREFPARDRSVLGVMLARGVCSPWTSSMGRLFDAVASLLGLRQVSGFEGDGAMAVEFAAETGRCGVRYGFGLGRRGGAGAGAGVLEVDWAPMVRGMLADLDRGVGVGDVAAGFQDTLVDMVMAVAREVGEQKVVLSGGCFQNRWLTEATVRRLRGEGFWPVWHQHLPPNDGGLALGQVVAAFREGE